MARPKSSGMSNVISSAVSDLVSAVTRLVDAVNASARAKVGAAAAAFAPKQRGPGKNNPKLKAAIKASWAKYTPAQRAARIAKMLAGRGLKPAKAAKKRGAKA